MPQMFPVPIVMLSIMVISLLLISNIRLFWYMSNNVSLLEYDGVMKTSILSFKQVW